MILYCFIIAYICGIALDQDYSTLTLIDQDQMMNNFIVCGLGEESQNSLRCLWYTSIAHISSGSSTRGLYKQ